VVKEVETTAGLHFFNSVGGVAVIKKRQGTNQICIPFYLIDRSTTDVIGVIF